VVGIAGSECPVLEAVVADDAGEEIERPTTANRVATAVTESRIGMPP